MLNMFVFSLNNRLQHLPFPSRQIVMNKILADLDKTDILKPLSPAEIEEEECDTEAQVASAMDFADQEQRIHQWQEHYKTVDLNKDEEDVEEAQQRKSRCGRNDMHDAVTMCDLDLIRKVYAANPQSISEKDNNGRTPISVAFLEGSQKVIELFKELGIIQAKA